MSTNMTIADRLAERLKNDALGTLISEEDLHDICKQALNKAFFTGTPAGYNTPATHPEVVVLAKDAMTAKVKKYVDDNFEKIINDEKFSKVMGQLMISSLGGVLMDNLQQSWQKQFFKDIHDNSNLIANIIRQKL